MTEAVNLDSKDRMSGWDTLEGGRQKIYDLGIQFLDFVYPTNVVTAKRGFHFIPFAVENFVGTALYSAYKMQSGGDVSHDYEEYNDVVQRVGKALAAQSPRTGLNFEFSIVNDKSLNAWCLPGGKIAINVGLLNALAHEKRDFGGTLPTFEEKVAALLSHEITHATARHFGRTMEFRIFMAALVKAGGYVASYFVRRYYDQKIDGIKYTAPSKEVKKIEGDRRKSLQNIQFIFDSIAKFLVSGLGKCESRTHELEADKYGMFLMYEAGKNPRETHLIPASAQSAIWLQQFFHHHHPSSSSGFFGWISNLISTHPTSEERLLANKHTWQELQAR